MTNVVFISFLFSRNINRYEIYTNVLLHSILSSFIYYPRDAMIKWLRLCRLLVY